MIRTFFLLFVLISLSSCSLLKKTAKKVEFQISEQQLEELISNSVNELVSQYWLSDFLVTNNERPIIVNSTITAPSNVYFHKEKAYELFDLKWTETGQVRVVKANEEQRLLLATELAKGKSVDYVITTSIIEKDTLNTTQLLFEVSLWNESILPATVVSKKIEQLIQNKIK